MKEPDDHDSAQGRSGFSMGALCGMGASTRGPVPTTLAREVHLVKLAKPYVQRWLDATAARERWIHARENRSVTLRRGRPYGSVEPWIALVFEDDKALTAARGMSALEALEGALRMLGLLR